MEMEADARGLTYEHYAFAQCLIGLERQHGVPVVVEMSRISTS